MKQWQKLRTRRYQFDRIDGLRKSVEAGASPQTVSGLLGSAPSPVVLSHSGIHPWRLLGASDARPRRVPLAAPHAVQARAEPPLQVR